MKRSAATSKTAMKRRKIYTPAPRFTAASRIYRSPWSAQKPEWKYLDLAINMTMDTAGALTLLNGLVPGNGASQRIGQTVQIHSLELRCITRVTAATGVDQTHRFAVVADKQANAAAMTGALYLNAATVYGMRLLENRKRFKTYLNKEICLNATGEPYSETYWHSYLQFRRPIVVEYNTGNAGTVADITSNSLYLYGIGSVAPGATAGAMAGYVRIRYTDM